MTVTEEKTTKLESATEKLAASELIAGQLMHAYKKGEPESFVEAALSQQVRVGEKLRLGTLEDQAAGRPFLRTALIEEMTRVAEGQYELRTSNQAVWVVERVNGVPAQEEDTNQESVDAAPENVQSEQNMTEVPTNENEGEITAEMEDPTTENAEVKVEAPETAPMIDAPFVAGEGEMVASVEPVGDNEAITAMELPADQVVPVEINEPNADEQSVSVPEMAAPEIANDTQEMTAESKTEDETVSAFDNVRKILSGAEPAKE